MPKIVIEYDIPDGSVDEHRRIAAVHRNVVGLLTDVAPEFWQGVRVTVHHVADGRTLTVPDNGLSRWDEPEARTVGETDPGFAPARDMGAACARAMAV